MKPIVRVAVACALLLAASPRASWALSVSGGDVPLPTKTVNGVQQVSWTSGYAQLLTADALAMCWNTQTERSGGGAGSTNATGTSADSDILISTIYGMVSAASCKSTCSNPAMTNLADVAWCAWLEGRKDPACNVDAVTGAPKGLDLSSLRSTSQTAAYQFPPVSGGTAPLGLSGTAATSVRDYARNQVAYAELNLCMAQLLREKLDTVQVAFASSDDLYILQQRVRERALAAVYGYSTISKALATPLPAPTVINHTDYWLAPLTLWGRGAFTSNLSWTQIGNDFASAIDLLIESTESVIDLKMRDPAGQRSLGEVKVTGLGPVSTGPRIDIANGVVYDGGGSYFDLYAPRRVIPVDMKAPEIGVLLGIARKANALKFSTAYGSYAFPQGNANSLYWASENYLRTAECTRKAISPCPLVTYLTVPTDYLLWQRYGITVGHARALSEAFLLALYGTPDGLGTDSWQYGSDPFSPSADGPIGPAQQLAFHMLGQHQVSTGGSGSRTVTIDPNFRMFPLRAHDIQAMRARTYLPVREVNPAGEAVPQIGWLRTMAGLTNGSEISRPFGAATTLALAREAILQLGTLAPSALPYNMYTRAKNALGLIEASIGTRQTLVRQQLAGTANTTACTGCVTLAPGANLDVDVLTKSNDTFRDIGIGAGIPHAATAAIDPSFVSIWGTSGASVVALPYTAGTVTVLSNSYEWRRKSGAYTSANPHGATVVLRAGTTGAYTYDHVVTTKFFNQGSYYYGSPGAAITYGGRFARLVEDAFRFMPEQWGTPAVDAFGLPHDWAPAADASLQGDSAGVRIEQHFIDRAMTSAKEATTAIQQSFDTLQQESIDADAAANSDTRAAQLTTLQVKSLCGAAPASACIASYTRTSPAIPACGTLPAAELTYCETVRTLMTNVVGASDSAVPLAALVATSIAGGTTAPTFREFAGGQLQSLFLSQWNAWNALKGALANAIGTINAASAQVTAADAEVTAAAAELTAARAQIVSDWATAVAQVAGLAAQRTTYNANITQYDTQLAAAKTDADNECRSPRRSTRRSRPASATAGRTAASTRPAT